MKLTFDFLTYVFELLHIKSRRRCGCNQHEVLYVIAMRVAYVIKPKGKSIQVVRLDDIPFAKQTDYILAKARLHTKPSAWIN